MTARTVSESTMVDAIGWGIYFLTAIAVIAFFGFENVDNGFAAMVEYARIVWTAIVQLFSSAFLGDFIGNGPIQEDSAIIDYIFDIREWLGV